MDNCVVTAHRLLSLLRVPHTKAYIEDSIMSHPEYPSLLSITDTLEKYQMETLGVKIGTDKLREIPLPGIVQIKDMGNEVFCVLDSISNGEVSYFDDKGKPAKISEEKFHEHWTGICLLVEKTEETKEPGIEKRISSKRVLTFLKVAVSVLFVGWTAISFVGSEIISDAGTALFAGVYLLLKTIGLGAGVLLLWFEVDQYNPTLQSFCSGGSSSGKINCNAVLNSKQAQLFNGNLSLSLLGFSYFFGSLGFLIFSGFSNAALSVLGYLSLMALPVVLFSAYYQALVIKQWCKFCILVQAVIVLEIATVLLSGFYKGPLLPGTIPLFVFFSLLPMVTWKLIKPLLEKEREANLYKRGLQKIKNSPEVLHGLLSKSRRIRTPTDGLGISFTNTGAKYDVIKVCNPYCGPCAKAQPVLEHLVKKGSINLQVLFVAKSENEKMAEPVRHFLALDSFGDSDKTQTALDDWYAAREKDYAVFSKKYPLNGELKLQNEKIDKMHDWCETENITHTPTVFINGCELPREYSVEDLKETLA